MNRSSEVTITSAHTTNRGHPRLPGTIEEFHGDESAKRTSHSKFYRHTSILMWKSYLQRQRRWRLLAIETFIGMALFVLAIFIARPVFLTPIETEPEPPLSTLDLLSSLQSHTILGYAPDTAPYDAIMNKAADLLGINVMKAKSENALNMLLYNKSREGTAQIQNPIIWVLWNSQTNNKWKFHIRNTERARFVPSEDDSVHPTNPHLRAGFLAVQVAISQAIVESVTDTTPNYEVTLVSMPVSPLMQESCVKKALSLILMCYTLAFLPAILETEALVVWETENMFKRALRMRSVGYSSMYLSWLVYTYLTALPVCVLGAIMLILTFRWIHLITALLIEFAYITVMAMVALIMAMFHNKPQIACIWTTLFTLLQTYLAELLVHHQYDTMYVGLTFLLQIVLPPLGLISAFNEFALLSTEPSETSIGILYMVASWGLLILIYFCILLLLQRTIGRQRAIGGQVTWQSIIFKKSKFHERHLLRQVEAPTRSEAGKVQEVDELLARAISFRDVNKYIMGKHVLQNVTFDIFRGEYTILFSEKIQEEMIDTLDDLMTGLTVADSGEIRVLGQTMTENTASLNSTYMMGYCHRSETLVDDLTVHEHFTLFSTICLWHQNQSTQIEYSHIRYKHLLSECNLRGVRYTRVRDLDVYYRAQLCWALARLLEPRVIIVPSFYDEPTYRAVIIDKIMKFRNHLTIISLDFSSLQLQYADRIFVFCSNLLVFGGTPAYMFFRHGRDYQIRLTLRVGNVVDPTESDDKKLLERAKQAGATVRAHLGSMVILRIPPIPTATVAEFIKDLTENSQKYGLFASSVNISVPDFEEVVRRAVKESKSTEFSSEPTTPEDIERVNSAIKRLFEPREFKRRKGCHTHFKHIANKFIQFHLRHKCLCNMTFLLAIVSGILLGMSMSSVLMRISDTSTFGMYKSDKLTVEYLEKDTVLVVRADNSTEAISIANAYVMSETDSTMKQVEHIKYVALPHNENFINYLMTRAIDSPQHYVYHYAYGMDVYIVDEKTIMIQALYSPLHRDHGAAARSLARVYMALIRHYSDQLDATIQVEDEPLALDLSPWMKDLARPPLFLQFILILTISHITLLPSYEYGLIRHTQKHATNFSPILYWMTLYMCDILFFGLLLVVMSSVMFVVMHITVPQSLFDYYDLSVLPAMLFLYGVGCVPQAYVFSLGPRVALNIMAFVIVNMVFGETTIVAKLFYGDALSYALNFMALSPQFNMAYAYVKIRQIFLYNVECVIFDSQNLCSSNTFHKCCERCGILQECFSKKGYFVRNHGILMEVLAMVMTATFFGTLLLLIEYKVVNLLFAYIYKKAHKDPPQADLKSGAQQIKMDVIEKERTITTKNKGPQVVNNTFGEYLCVSNVSSRLGAHYIARNVYLGLGKGEALAISGLKRHGRLKLCEILAGYRIMSNGSSWIMSKWRLNKDPHLYSARVSIGCESRTLPPWMKMSEALLLIGILRGLPEKVARKEVVDIIDALGLHHLSQKVVETMKLAERQRLHFAAAVIGAPPVIILDEMIAGEKHSVRRAMYSILYLLRKRGHAIVTASSNIESHMPVTNRLAFIIDGVIYDVDTIDMLISRYSRTGFTVVVHLKDEVDVMNMFSKYFQSFTINDCSDVLVNVQIFDSDLTCNSIFQKMEALANDHSQVYSYIIADMTIDYIYNTLMVNEKGLLPATGFLSWRWAKKIISSKPKKMPSEEEMRELIPFRKNFDITSLIGLPWSVIFHSGGNI